MGISNGTVQSVSVNGEEVAVSNATGADNTAIVSQYTGSSVVAAQIVDSTTEVMEEAIAASNSTDNSTNATTTSLFMAAFQTNVATEVDKKKEEALANNDTSLIE